MIRYNVEFARLEYQRSMGAGKHEEAEKTMGAVFTLSVIIGILFTVGKRLASPPLFLS